MKKIATTLALACAVPAAAFADSLTPTTFSATLGVGESVTITKTLTVDAGTPTTSKVDVFFLADTTGSMGGSIAGVKAAAASILSAASGLGDVAFAVGEYKDSYDPYRFRLNTNMTANTAAVTSGINMWSASGGYDWPEANLYALEHAATDTAWRTGSERILVWFGDAPGHDPDGGSTEASATAALIAKGIQVEAITVSGSGLNSACGGATGEGGSCTAGQATRITTATGGHLYSSSNTSAIVSVISNAITTAVSTYNTVGLDLSGVPSGVTVTASPASYTGPFDRSIARTFTFVTTFTGDAEGDYPFKLCGTVDGGIVACEDDHIVVKGSSVPEPGVVFLMGLGLVGMGLARRAKA